MKMKLKVSAWFMAVLVATTGVAFNANAAVDYEMLGKNPVKRSRKMLHNEWRKIHVELRKDQRRIRRDSLGDKLLHRAVRLGRGYIVAKLLEEPDVNVNARNRNGNTVLHVAVNNGRWGIITYLVRHAVHLNFNLRNNYGQTPLDIAKKNGTEAIFKSCFPANTARQLI